MTEWGRDASAERALGRVSRDATAAAAIEGMAFWRARGQRADAAASKNERTDQG